MSTAGQDARMCWKLTAVFGLTWILCVAAEHHIALRIIFIIFNSLQGNGTIVLLPWTGGSFAPLGPFLCTTTEEKNGLLPQSKGPRTCIE
jgi:hypothetical protein